jgi:hypothetical protein
MLCLAPGAASRLPLGAPFKLSNAVLNWKDNMADNQDDTDYYSDEETPTATADRPGEEGQDDGQEPSAEGDHEDIGETTALLPKSILAGKKFSVGDSVWLKIDAIHDNDVAVSYNKGDQKDSTSSSDSGDSDYD